jgi:hypothetical protein
MGLQISTDEYDRIAEMIEEDSKFLMNCKIIDYSLLVGIHDKEKARRKAKKSRFIEEKMTDRYREMGRHENKSLTLGNKRMAELAKINKNPQIEFPKLKKGFTSNIDKKETAKGIISNRRETQKIGKTKILRRLKNDQKKEILGLGDGDSRNDTEMVLSRESGSKQIDEEGHFKPDPSKLNNEVKKI